MLTLYMLKRIAEKITESPVTHMVLLDEELRRIGEPFPCTFDGEHERYEASLPFDSVGAVGADLLDARGEVVLPVDLGHLKLPTKKGIITVSVKNIGGFLCD